jgi:pentatricopeptide repeat protein
VHLLTPSPPLFLPVSGLRPNLVSYNTAINACVRAGSLAKALDLLAELKRQKGLQPDTVRTTSLKIQTVSRLGPDHGISVAVWFASKVSEFSPKWGVGRMVRRSWLLC